MRGFHGGSQFHLSRLVVLLEHLIITLCFYFVLFRVPSSKLDWQMLFSFSPYDPVGELYWIGISYILDKTRALFHFPVVFPIKKNALAALWSPCHLQLLTDGLVLKACCHVFCVFSMLLQQSKLVFWLCQFFDSKISHYKFIIIIFTAIICLFYIQTKIKFRMHLFFYWNSHARNTMLCDMITWTRWTFMRFWALQVPKIWAWP